MFRYRIGAIALISVFAISTAIAQTPKGSDGRDADRSAILGEIGRITQAFIDGDIETIYKTHSQDWSGFLHDGQTVPIKGIDDYMKENGLTYPPPAGYKLPAPNPNLHYKITNYIVNFVTRDVGVASFTLDFPYRDGVHFNRLRIMDVFTKRDGKWLQTASYTVTDPAWKGDQLVLPSPISNQAKQRLFQARETVWRAWYSGDVQQLEKLIPEEAVVISGGGPKGWSNRQAILDGAKGFAAGGGKLTRLEFPRNEIQAYGNTFILFTSYSFDIEHDGKKDTITGNAIETFVKRWLDSSSQQVMSSAVV
jgi:hypothetical protein